MTGINTMDEVERLRSAPYVSLETFRKSGAGVATPVWCAPDGDALFVFSAGDAGKVKRLRNGSRARVAVCDVRGKVLGPWHDATAVVLEAPAEVERSLAALRRKYGWQMRVADLGAKLTGRFHRRAYLRIDLAREKTDK
ncbi:MAG: PPOX class F420-dependent oxidoreductase [Pseudomonadales bacterium]|jgi:hypothetical protein